MLILLGGIYLALRGHLNWHIPVSILISVFAFSGLFYVLGLSPFSPGFMLFSGGLMLGAWYMATDLVTSPVTNAGCWIFGVSIGLLVVIIRIWGGLPEGVMYAILLMNALVPFINRATQPRKFGSTKGKTEPAVEQEKEPKATRRPRLGKSSEASGTRGVARSSNAVERSRLPPQAGAGKRDST